MKVGDRIVAVDGRAVAKHSVHRIQEHIQGQPGSAVKMQVLRASGFWGVPSESTITLVRQDPRMDPAGVTIDKAGTVQDAAAEPIGSTLCLSPVGDLHAAGTTSDEWIPLFDCDVGAFAVHQETELHVAMKGQEAGQVARNLPAAAEQPETLSQSRQAQSQDDRTLVPAQSSQAGPACLVEKAAALQVIRERRGALGSEAVWEKSAGKGEGKVLESGELTARLTAFYSMINPAKVGDVPRLAQLSGNDPSAINDILRLKYGGLDLCSNLEDISNYLARWNGRSGLAQHPVRLNSQAHLAMASSQRASPRVPNPQFRKAEIL